MINLTLVDVPSQKALMSSNFTPILGQYGVGIREFCNLFNINTKVFLEDLPLCVTVKAESRDKITLENLRISKNFLVNFFLKIVKNKILSLKLIYILFCIDLKFVYNKSISLKSQFKTKLAYIKSFGVNLSNDSSSDSIFFSAVNEKFNKK